MQMVVTPTGYTVDADTNATYTLQIPHYWDTGLTKGQMPETAVNIILYANEAGLSSAIGTLQKERNMRASLLRAMESDGDKIDSNIGNTCSNGGQGLLLRTMQFRRDCMSLNNLEPRTS